MEASIQETLRRIEITQARMEEKMDYTTAQLFSSRGLVVRVEKLEAERSKFLGFILATGLLGSCLGWLLELVSGVKR